MRACHEAATRKMVPWNFSFTAHTQNFQLSKVLEKSQREVPLFLEIPKLLFNADQDRLRESFVPKTSRISSAVLTQYRRVTDTYTDRHTHTDIGS